MNGTVETLHKDQLGSIRAMTDQLGAKSGHSAYKPFGADADPLRQTR